MMISKTTPSIPTGVELTDDEWDTILKVIHDWGLIDTYHIADYSKVSNLQKKFKTDNLE